MPTKNLGCLLSILLIIIIIKQLCYSHCNSQLLSCIDNSALLDLDIVWCYLSLRSVAHLPEAYQRLQRCDESFRKSYGENLERLIALKGSPGNNQQQFPFISEYNFNWLFFLFFVNTR